MTIIDLETEFQRLDQKYQSRPVSSLLSIQIGRGLLHRLFKRLFFPKESNIWSPQTYSL